MSKPNSQVHAVLNSISDKEVYYPHFILQVNGVKPDGCCKECWAIKIQTNVFAHILFNYIEDNTIDDYYQSNLDAYEWSFGDTFNATHTGVDVYYIENNKIKSHTQMLKQTIINGNIQYYFDNQRITPSKYFQIRYELAKKK